MNATVWASTASLELAECATEQRRRDQAQPKLTAPADNAPRRTLQPGDVPPVRKSAGQADPTSSASSKRSDRGAFIKPLDEPIIDTTSDNIWVEAFVTFVSAFAAVERKMILTRGRELKGDGERCYIGREAQAQPLPKGTGSADGPSQRAVARLLGVDHQSNSRSAPVSVALSFCSEILNVSTPSTTPKPDANGRVSP